MVVVVVDVLAVAVALFGQLFEFVVGIMVVGTGKVLVADQGAEIVVGPVEGSGGVVVQVVVFAVFEGFVVVEVVGVAVFSLSVELFFYEVAIDVVAVVGGLVGVEGAVAVFQAADLVAVAEAVVLVVGFGVARGVFADELVVAVVVFEDGGAADALEEATVMIIKIEFADAVFAVAAPEVARVVVVEVFLLAHLGAAFQLEPPCSSKWRLYRSIQRIRLLSVSVMVSKYSSVFLSYSTRFS